MSDKEYYQELSEPDQSEDFFRDINIQFLIHELKSPLGVIEANTRMLLECQSEFGRLSKSQKKIIHRSMRSTNKLRDIIQTLLEVGSSQSGNITPRQFNVVKCTTEVLFDTLETIAGKDIEFSENVSDQAEYLALHGIFLVYSPEMYEVGVYQDKTKFMHILANLVRNGLHHKKSRVTVQLEIRGENLQVIIEDDGPGIGPDTDEILFKRYTQTHSHTGIRRKGHGLGLASSRILTRCLGGDITVDTQYSEGARFILSLPCNYKKE